MKDYTIKVVTVADYSEKLANYFVRVAREESALYNEVFKVEWKNFDLLGYIQTGRLAVCLHKGEPVGVLLCRLGQSVFDAQVVICSQDLFYTTGGPRAAKMLMDDFIDFGKAHAKYIVTMIADKTNLRGRSLERLGFKKSEVHYWMET